jgi:hypothetical protein
MNPSQLGGSSLIISSRIGVRKFGGPHANATNRPLPQDMPFVSVLQENAVAVTGG